ncbi:putative peroxidase [Rosa chinensis]|uniref:Peroxidase n=1 Tax=Rosa chinensis TaxID=74649 RepID=A0A2P6P264_ROSCH|nr:peroxidase 41 [Rosa chinensis]PRQ16014.1 putative peroxidase [Rosa chinensis]
MAMAAALPALLVLCIAFPLTQSAAPPPVLREDYYSKTCPDFQKIVRETVNTKQMANPVTASGTLRLFFHDCMVTGCDASLLINSNHVNKAERDAEPNQSLSGDAYEVITKAKTTLELTCPGVVSCADIMAEATRDLVSMVGGPFYPVKLGRLDGLVSKADSVYENLPRTNQTVDELIEYFGSKGFTVEEMVALSGAHTIGFSHCKEFTGRLFNYNKTTPTDPDMHPKLAEGLKKTCANFEKDTSMSAFNDMITPGKFDNMYYQNLKRGLGLLASDNALVKDPRTRPIVELFARDQEAFFKAFSKVMEKTGLFGVKTGKDGEVRRRCDALNNAISA